MKRRLKKHWPLVGLALVGITVALYFARASGPSKKDLPFFLDAIQEGVTLKEVHYTHQDPQKETTWILDAREVTLSEDKDFMTFSDFWLRVEPKGRPALVMRGRAGDYSRKSRILRLWGDLEGETEDGYRFMTQCVSIRQPQAEVTTDAQVRLWGPSFSVEGEGLFCDLKGNLYRILSRTVAVVERGGFL